MRFRARRAVATAIVGLSAMVAAACTRPPATIQLRPTSTSGPAFQKDPTAVQYFLSGADVVLYRDTVRSQSAQGTAPKGVVVRESDVNIAVDVLRVKAGTPLVYLSSDGAAGREWSQVTMDAGAGLQLTFRSRHCLPPATCPAFGKEPPRSVDSFFTLSHVNGVPIEQAVVVDGIRYTVTSPTGAALTTLAYWETWKTTQTSTRTERTAPGRRVP